MKEGKRRKRKLKYNRIIIALLIIVLPIIIVCNINNISNLYGHFKYGYKVHTIQLFKDNNIYDYIKDKKHSKTLEEAINSKYYESDYIDDYYKVNYNKNDTFIKNVNSLLKKGYQTNEINSIFKKLNNDSINIILKYDYDMDLTNYLKLEYFKENNLDRYLAFKFNDNKFSTSSYQDKFDEDNLTYEDIVTYVNVDLDKNYYDDAKEITDTNNLLILVNKYNSLNKDFVPDDLERIQSKYADGTQKLRKEAKEKFEEMCDYLETINLHLIANSAYRSYTDQEELYNEYVTIRGKYNADISSARPGYSEHETGLAVDVGSKNSNIFANSEEYKWMKDNSYKYGFILRYPKGKEYIMGYMFESWHYRYVGVDIATYIHDNDLIFEEYIGRKKN